MCEKTQNKNNTTESFSTHKNDL